MKIKRILSLIIISLLLFTLAACSDDDECQHQWGEWVVGVAPTCGAGGYSTRTCLICHEEDRSVKYALPHEFSEEWVYDGTYHWHKALCEHEGEVSDKGTHSFSGNTCSVCGALRATQGLQYRGLLGQNKYIVIGVGSTLDANVVVARYYNGYSIVGVGDEAFARADGLLSVYLQPYIETVGDGAFRDSKDLTEVFMAPGIQYIGSDLFNGSTSLERVIFSGSRAEFEAIPKDENWARGTSGFRIECRDGVIEIPADTGSDNSN